MSAIVVLAIILVSLFTLSFITGRRFGTLGLALAAGSVLADVLGYNFGIAASIAGVPSNALSQALVSSFLILLPSGLLLFKGNSYKTIIGKLIGSLLYVVLALAFLIRPFGSTLVFNSSMMEVYSIILENYQTVIGAGIIIAVIDLLLTKTIKLKEKLK